MAGRVPLNLTKVPQRKVGMPLPVAHMAPIEAKRQQGKAIAAGIGSIGEMAAQYAQQHKDTDIRADEAGFALFSKDRMTKANDAAARTSNPDEVRRIYEGVESDIEGYIGGRGETGTPNVKWKDHQTEMRNQIQPIKGRIKEISNRRVLDIYRADTRAKAEMIANDSISRDDIAGVKEAASILQESGVLTTEEAKGYVADGAARIADNKKKRTYNIANESLASLEYQHESGAITTAEKIDRLDAMEEGIGEIHKDYQPIIKSRIYSMKTKAYKKEKADLNKGLARIVSGLESGDYNEADVRYFMSARVQDYDDLVLVAQQARLVAESSKVTGVPQVLTAVDNAMRGYSLHDKGEQEKYTIDDAFKAIKAANSSAGPLGSIMLGAAMMAPDSGSDDEGLFNNWSVTSRAWKNKPVTVAEDSILAQSIHMMGNYAADGDVDAGWVSKTLDKTIRIQNDDSISEDEKMGKVRELFKGRARLVAQEVSAPQVTAAKTRYSEGDTRTHPKTGITYTWRGGKWQK